MCVTSAVSQYTHTCLHVCEARVCHSTHILLYMCVTSARVCDFGCVTVHTCKRVLARIELYEGITHLYVGITDLYVDIPRLH